MEYAPHAAEAILCIPEETVVFYPFTPYGFENRCPKFKKGIRAIGR